MHVHKYAACTNVTNSQQSLTCQRSLIGLQLRASFIPLQESREVVEEWLPCVGTEQDVVADVVQRVATGFHLAL